MDYNKLYFSIINRAKNRTTDAYTERHHIIPRFAGGGDESSNIVRLTAREHFICHWLLTKIHPSGYMHNKAIHAFAMMAWCISEDQCRTRCGSRLYEKLRKSLSEIRAVTQKGQGNSQYGTVWIFSPDQRKNRKIKSDQSIPEGWRLGRVTDWDSYFIKLETSKFKDQPKQYVNCLTGREQEFYELYDRCGSMNTTLKQMNLIGAVGSVYYFAKQLLEIRDSQVDAATKDK